MKLPAKIRRLRIDNGLTGERFGALCGVSRQQVSHWESGIAIPKVEKLIDLKKSLNFSLDWLLSDGEGDPPLVARSPRAAYFVEKLALDQPANPKTAYLSELMDVAASLSDQGLWELIGTARYLARTHPNPSARATQ